MTNSAEKFDAPITVDLPGLGERRFRQSGELAKWAEKERDFWNEIDGRIDGRGPFSPCLRSKDFANHADSLRAEARSFGGTDSSDQKEQILEKINRYIHLYTDGVIPASQTAEAIEINKLSEIDPDAASVALFIARKGFRGMSRNQNERVSFEQIVDPLSFMGAWEIVRESSINVKNSLEAQKKSLSNLRSRWDANIFGLREKADLFEKSSFERALRILRLTAERMRKHRRLFAQHQAAMLKMEKAFSTEMQLRAAEKFWSNKRRLNRKREKLAFQRLCAVGGIGFIVLMIAYWIISGAFIPRNGIDFSQAVVYLIPTLIYIWLLRIIASDYRSNKNLADDAEEREAMVMTFKALEYENRVKDEERLVVLNALFRPHGESAEETVPIPVWEAVVSRVAKPS